MATYEVRDSVAWIGFDRPEKHNAFRDEDLASLSEAIRRLDDDGSARIGILFGEGRSFSSGGDVQARLQASMAEGSIEGRATERDAFLVDCANWKPVIAAVHGYCLGHALATALLCDHLVCARSAVFEVTETRIGLPMPSLLPRLGHPAFAADVAMTGRRFSGEEAWAGGMVTRLVDDGEGAHLAGAEALAQELLAVPDGPVRAYVQLRRARIVEETAAAEALLPPFDWTADPDAQAAVEAHASRTQR